MRASTVDCAVNTAELTLSLCKSHDQPRILSVMTKSWDDWVSYLTAEPVVGDKSGTGLVLGPCKGSRSASNLAHYDMFALDGDASLDEGVLGAPSITTAVEALTSLGWAGVVTPSWSDGLPDKGSRWRAWLPLSRSASKSELSALSAGIHKAFKLGGCPVREAAESKRYSQIWFFGRIREGADYTPYAIDGMRVDVDQIIGAHAATQHDEGITTVDPDIIKYCEKVGLEGVNGMLLGAGYTAADCTGENELGRWCRPDSSTGQAGLVAYKDEAGGEAHLTIKEFGGGGVFADGLVHDAFDVLRMVQFNGDKVAALVHAKLVVGEVSSKRVSAFNLACGRNAVRRDTPNAVTILQQSGAFDNVLSYDTFNHSTVVCPEWVAGQLGYDEPAGGWGGGEQITAVQRAISQVSDEYERSVLGAEYVSGTAWTCSVVQQGVEAAAKARPFDPLVAFLDECGAWDGVLRVDTWLDRMLGVGTRAYEKECMRVWLAGAVARAYDPGVDFQLVPVLLGKQGLGKSPVMKVLFGAAWWSDKDIVGLEGQDRELMAAVNGHWVFELSESMGRRQQTVEDKKAFVSRPKDSTRRLYSHDTVEIPRRFVMYATSNRLGGVLADTTGNKRYLPLWCTKAIEPADWKWLEANRKQVWAEAVALWRGGQPLTMTGAAGETALREQADCMQEGMYHDEIVEFLNREGCAGSSRDDCVCKDEIRAHIEGRRGVNIRSDKDIEYTLSALGYSTLKKGETGWMQRFDGKGRRAWFPDAG